MLKMFRIAFKTSSLFNNVCRTSTKVIVYHERYKTFLGVPNVCLKTLFYSNDAKYTEIPKSPLAGLITNSNSKEKPEEVNDESDKKERREQSWRRMKYTFWIFGATFTCIGIYLVLELGKPRIDENGVPVTDEYSNMSAIKQYLLRTVNELNYYRQLIREPSREKLLPDIVKHPYYSPQYTLVLEFTDVVVHPEWTYLTGWRFKKRPGLDNFLEALSGIYEIVIYTAEQGMTVFPIVDALDPKNHINYKLVRDATLFIDGRHVKDLDKLNRDLARTIVIDWDGNCTKYHPENVFQIPRWSGNDDDATLMQLTSFLLAISQNQIDDVREVVKYYNQFDDPLATFREKQKKLIEMSEISSTNQTEQTTPLKKWTPSFLKRSY